MADTFDLVFPELLKHEGGYQINASDPGNYTGGRIGVGNLVGTNYGVSAGAYSNYLGRPATVADMQAITPEQARPFFRDRYWNAVNADNLPLGLDYAMADMAYHSGPDRAIRNLQNTLGLQSTGKLGTADYNAISVHGDPRALAGQYIANRRTFLEGLSNWDTFKGGWTNRLNEIQNTLADWNQNSPLNNWGRLHPAQLQNLNSEQFMKMAAQPYGNRTATAAFGGGDMWGYDTAPVGNDTDYLDYFSRAINTGQLPVAWDAAYDAGKARQFAYDPLSNPTARYRQQDQFGNSLGALLGNQDWYDPRDGVTYNPNYTGGYDSLGRPLYPESFASTHPNYGSIGDKTFGGMLQGTGNYMPQTQRDQFGQPMGGSGATLYSPTLELGGGMTMADAQRQNADIETVFQQGAQDHMFYEGQLNNLTANNGWTTTNVFQPQQVQGYTYQPQIATTTWGVNNPTVDYNIASLNPQNNPQPFYL